MNVRLWHSPYNGLYVWFDRANLRRCSIGWGDLKQEHVNYSFWWAVFGFSGGTRGMDRCSRCDGTGSRFLVVADGQAFYFPNTREGYEQAMAHGQSVDDGGKNG